MTGKDPWLLPEGIEELLPADAAVAEQLRRDILDLFRVWGYQLIMPPLVEFTDSLLVGTGEDVALHSFRLTDQLSGKPMAIRADITPQAARIDAHSMRSKKVNRLCYAGSVLYTRPKSLLGSRCPIQAGAELYGDASIDADIEVISLMLETIAAVGGAGSVRGGDALTLDLGHVGIYSAVVDAIRARQPELGHAEMDELRDAMQRKSAPDLKLFAAQYLTDQDFANALCQLPLLCGGREVLEEARALLPSLALPSAQAVSGFEAALQQLEQVADAVAPRFPDVNVYFDLTELRGFDYHTGLVFAAYVAGSGSALANGGRYDEVGRAFGQARPATGFNTDIKALINAFDTSPQTDGAQSGVAPNGDAIIAAPRRADPELWHKIRALRAAGDVVVSLPDDELTACQRWLAERNGSWVVEAQPSKHSK